MDQMENVRKACATFGRGCGICGACPLEKVCSRPVSSFPGDVIEKKLAAWQAAMERAAEKALGCVQFPEGGGAVSKSVRYVYGMKYRGFAPGCQPMEGLVERKDDPSGEYYDLLIYDRPLSVDELRAYELFIVQEDM